LQALLCHIQGREPYARTRLAAITDKEGAGWARIQVSSPNCF
jgi:hypothetical protein